MTAWRSPLPSSRRRRGWLPERRARSASPRRCARRAPRPAGAAQRQPRPLRRRRGPRCRWSPRRAPPARRRRCSNGVRRRPAAGGARPRLVAARRPARRASPTSATRRRALLADAVVDGDAAPLARRRVRLRADARPTTRCGAASRRRASPCRAPPCAPARRRRPAAAACLVSPGADGGARRRAPDAQPRPAARLERAAAAGTDDGGDPRYETTSTPAPAAWKGAVAATIADIAAGRFASWSWRAPARSRATRPFDCEPRRGAPAPGLSELHDVLARRRRRRLPRRHAGAAGARARRRASTPPRWPARRRAAPPRRPTRRWRDALLGQRQGPARARHRRRGDRAALRAAVRRARRRRRRRRVLRLPNVQHLLTPIRAPPGGRARTCSTLVDRLHPDAGGRRRAARRGARGAAAARGAGARLVRRPGRLVRRQPATASSPSPSARALVRDRHAVLFAGAGIVAGSDPEAELAETRLKLQPLLARCSSLSGKEQSHDSRSQMNTDPRRTARR